jgi:hypothetical protein
MYRICEEKAKNDIIWPRFDSELAIGRVAILFRQCDQFSRSKMFQSIITSIVVQKAMPKKYF